MNKVERPTLEEIFREFKVEFKEKRGSKFYFRMHLNREMCNSPIEVLDLSVRSYNVLKRAGYNTVGELTGAIAEGLRLGKIRNCGSKSVREIMETLFLFQYESLEPRRRKEYLHETILLNKERNNES